MARALFRGAPELSRLFIESPIQLISEFLSHSQFSVFLSDAMAAVPADAEDQIRTERMAEALKALKSDRINLIEIEALGRRLVLCHYPLRSWNLMGKGALQLHGHSHGRLKPMARQVDVGVDCQDFAPVPLARLLAPRKRQLRTDRPATA